MRAKHFLRPIKEAAGDGAVANAVVAEVIKLIGEGHTEVSPDVITTKVSAALGKPFMLKDLVAANNSSPELQHYIDSINPTKIKFSTDILTVKNQDPVKEKERSQAGVASMAARAAGRSRLGESIHSQGYTIDLDRENNELVFSRDGVVVHKERAAAGKGRPAGLDNLKKRISAVIEKLEDALDPTGVTEGREFGAYYSEQLAQSVYNVSPKLSVNGKADELTDLGFKLAVKDVGVKQAQHLFAYDEDFTSDFVSAYSWLQQGGGQGVTEGAEDFAGTYSPEAIRIGKKFCEVYNITDRDDVQLAVELIDLYLERCKYDNETPDLNKMKSDIARGFRQVYRGLGKGPSFRKRFDDLDENEISVTGGQVKHEKGYYGVWQRKPGTDRWTPVTKYPDEREANDIKSHLERQGYEVIVRESVQPGEYLLWTVHFADGSSTKLQVPSDEISFEQIKKFFAKKGKEAVKVDYSWDIHGSRHADIPEPEPYEKKLGISEEQQRLDPKCWKGYKKQGTKMKGGVRVNNCVPKE